MKTFKLFIAVAFSFMIALVLMPQGSMAQDLIEHGIGFVDENGDGYNDNAQDSDNDGIPNGQDSDYVPANDGTGSRFGRLGVNRLGTRVHGLGFIDEDGDGFNDNAPDSDNDGIPNGIDPDYIPLNDGSGVGNGLNNGRHHRVGGLGAGDCDGTGVKSSGRAFRAAK
ncbi:MAG: hypothetical protein JXR87_01295 [Candidatus Marinimicrobia bacterium]|nr:hypothetical protein [Candidatus Neomarinimicrobiota bacterium]